MRPGGRNPSVGPGLTVLIRDVRLRERLRELVESSMDLDELRAELDAMITPPRRVRRLRFRRMKRADQCVKGFVKVPSWMINDPDTPNEVVRVYAYFALYEGKWCRKSMIEIAAELRMNLKRLNRCVKILKDRKLIAYGEHRTYQATPRKVTPYGLERWFPVPRGAVTSLTARGMRVLAMVDQARRRRVPDPTVDDLVRVCGFWSGKPVKPSTIRHELRELRKGGWMDHMKAPVAPWPDPVIMEDTGPEERAVDQFPINPEDLTPDAVSHLVYGSQGVSYDPVMSMSELAEDMMDKADDPRLPRLDDRAALALWTRAAMWAALRGDPGWIPWHAVSEMHPEATECAKILVDGGMWTPHARGSDIGWAFVGPDQAPVAAPSDTPRPKRKAKPRPPVAPRFGEFWAVYPRQTAIADAEKAWTKAAGAGADPQAVIDAAKLFRISCRTTEKKYIPYPATWLNRRQWEDGPDPVPMPRSTTDDRVEQALDVGRRMVEKYGNVDFTELHRQRIAEEAARNEELRRIRQEQTRQELERRRVNGWGRREEERLAREAERRELDERIARDEQRREIEGS